MGARATPTRLSEVLKFFIGVFALVVGAWLSYQIGGPNQLATIVFLLLVPFAISCAMQPVWGFGFSLLLLPFSYQFQLASLDLTIGEPFFTVALAFLLVSIVGKRRWPTLGGYGFPMSLFLIGLVISVTLWPTETAFGILRKVLAGVGALVALASGCHLSDIRMITRCFMASGLIVASVALLQGLTGSFGFEERFVQQRGLFEALFSGRLFSGELTEVRMANSTFNHFNMAGAYLDLVFPFFFLQALVNKRATDWLGVSLILFGINATHSRGSLLALLVSTVFLLFLLYRRPWARWFSVLLWGIVTSGVILAAIVSNIEETLSLYGPAGRFVIWQASWEGFLANPIFGNGLGRTVDLVEAHAGIRYAAHNIYLQLLADIGLVGLVGFVLLVTMFFGYVRRVLSHEAKGKLFILGWAGAMVGYLTHGLVDHALFQPAFTAFFFVALAVASLASKGRVLSYGPQD